MAWTQAELIPWQDRVDMLADDATEGMRPGPPQQIYDIVAERARDGHAGARRFFEATRDLPDWCDPQSLERGRRLVVELGLELALMLTTGGLIEGYASPNLSTPLVHTGRLRTDAAKRLYETGQMVHNARAPGGLAPDGLGRQTVLQVRLLHSVIRRMMESRGYRAPDGGRAIHQLDMAHTALAFSHKGPTKLARLGIVLTGREHADIHHFFRVVNALHGVDPTLLPETPAGSAQLCTLLDSWRFDLDYEDGAALAHAAVKSLAHEPPFFLPEPAIGTLARLAMSTEQADRWGLADDPFWNRAFEGLAQSNRVVTTVWRRLPGVARLRARMNVALYGRTLVSRLGPDPGTRAFGAVAGEESRFGPGLEPWSGWTRDTAQPTGGAAT